MTWTLADIPDMHRRTALVTGATDGLGFETARELARRGARVLLAGRNASKGEAALKRIRDEQPGADVTFESVELGDLATVRSLAQRAGAQGVDILINNAGIMGVPKSKTTQGFESQLGVNYLSHFVLTGSLLGALRAAKDARVVSLSSNGHKMGRLDFDDLQGDKKYGPFKAYTQSKLAMLLFAQELQRRSDWHGWGLLSVAAHPGFARTNLFKPEDQSKFVTPLLRAAERAISQGAAEGAQPTLLAATSPDAPPASYWGPTGMMEMKGPPGRAGIAKHAADPAAAARLWEVSQQLTDHPFGEGA
ncbi:oxidoreductase [Caulobacter sp. S45]|uniref:oxidoreductase n=1 Tax=Caulobacter sp. S45 TaxID=1641861 RepID=UPI0015755C9D|nr:oxidoreductase [Caulobacter sp. S45]